MQEIRSLKDERIQFARSLSTAKGRIAQRRFLIEGAEALQWALDAGVRIESLFIAAKNHVPEPIPDDINAYQVSEGLLKKITGTNYLIPLVGVGQMNVVSEESPFHIVLDGVNDFGNIGTIIRTCHAFGIHSILSTRRDFDLFQRKTVDASRGKVFSTNCHCFDGPQSIIDALRAQGVQIIVTSPYGDNLQSLTELPDAPVALIVGNETHGVSEAFLEHADLRVQIPMSGAVESLNVGVATGISLYELTLKQVIGMIEKKIKSTLGREMNVVAMLMQEALNKALQKVSEFSSTQVVFLMVLKCDVSMSVREMQKQFGIPNEDVEQFLKPLKAKQLIVTDEHRQLMISDTGIETLGKLWTIVENTEQQVLHGFSDEEKIQLKRILARLKKNCVDIINAP